MATCRLFHLTYSASPSGAVSGMSGTQAEPGPFQDLLSFFSFFSWWVQALLKTLGPAEMAYSARNAFSNRPNFKPLQSLVPNWHFARTTVAALSLSYLEPFARISSTYRDLMKPTTNTS